MNAPKRQSLWNLLACASRVQASAGFCQRVALRASAIPQHSAHPILRIAAAAAAVFVLATGTAIFLVPAAPRLADWPAQASQPFAGQDAWAEEFEGIVFMDALLGVHDPAQLDDEALARLLVFR